LCSLAIKRYGQWRRVNGFAGTGSGALEAVRVKRLLLDLITLNKLARIPAKMSGHTPQDNSQEIACVLENCHTPRTDFSRDRGGSEPGVQTVTLANSSVP